MQGFAVDCTASLPRGSSRRRTWIASTFDSKSTWWIGCLPGSGQTCSLPPLALQIKPTFLSSSSFISLSHFLSHLLQSGCEEQIVTLCDMAVRQNYAASPSPCQYPNSRMSVRGLREVPLDGLSLQVLGARLPTCPCSQVCISDLAAQLCRYIIKMGEAQCDCVQWPLSSPQVENTWY